MDLKILEIASNTENKRVLEHFTHSAKNKNRICGDEMQINLVVANNIIKDMAYQCKSCAYCQASVSLLSRIIKNKNLDQVSSFASIAEKMFQNSSLKIDTIWKEFADILNPENLTRKECLLLPIHTVLKALKH
jgi:nitrogen fixation NifU-like protein